MSAEGEANDSLRLLQEVLRVSEDWLGHLPVHDPEREGVASLQMLVENLLGDGERTPSAMSNVRALLCTHCRHLNAARGRCAGKSLDRCLLLKELAP